MDIFSLATIGLAFFTIAITPGPANISNAAIAMSRGRKVSLIYGLGLSCGLVVWGVIAASGLGAILQTSVYLLMSLKVLGGLYLIWLAYQSLKSATIESVNDKTEQDCNTSNIGWFIHGLVLNLSNPKTVIAWMAALSVGLSPDANLSQLIAGVLVCICAGLLSNLFYSMCFSLKIVMAGYIRIQKQLNLLFSAIYTVAGVSLIRSAVDRNGV
jgi:threonine efflux protein